MSERDFKGIWIPKEIWLDERLSALEKVIFCEIDSLSSEDRGCFASNKHIADFCQCSETKVSNAISKLVEIGYVVIESFDGRNRICKSALQKVQVCLTENARQPYKKCKADLQKVQDSNTDSNTENNTGRNTKRFIKPTIQEVKAYCLERNNGVDAERWYNYYSANGWKVGKNPMKDWKATVRYWERQNKKDVDYEAMAEEISRGFI